MANKILRLDYRFKVWISELRAKMLKLRSESFWRGLWLIIRFLAKILDGGVTSIIMVIGNIRSFWDAIWGTDWHAGNCSSAS